MNKDSGMSEYAIRCDKCGYFLIGYDPSGNAEDIILRNITLRKCRCGRRLHLDKYTNKMLLLKANGHEIRI